MASNRTNALSFYRRELPLALCLLWLLLTGGCGSAPTVERAQYPLPKDVDRSEAPVGKYGGQFVITIPSEPRTFNPLAVEDAYSSTAIDLMLSSLVGFDPVKEEFIPALAKAWDVSEDRLSFTFHLREGVLWSDGTPITADDVLFTFDTLFNPAVPNRYAVQFTIGGEKLRYEKIDPYTVRFHTAEPYAPFINDVGQMNILPRHAFKDAPADAQFLQQWGIHTATQHPERILSSGPFRLKSFKTGERVIFEPNPHYWRADSKGQRLPYIDHFILNIVADANAATVYFATGQTDFANISPTEIGWVQQAAQTHDFTLYNSGTDQGISFIWFNLNPGSREKPFVAPHKLKWFSDRRFRQAVAYGLDRPGIIQAAYFGLAEPLYSSISSANTKWHNPDVRHYDYDPQRARQLLQDAGFVLKANQLYDADGHPVEFELQLSRGNLRNEAIANTFRENMRQLGIQVRISELDFQTLVSKITNSYDYEAAILGLTGSRDPSGGKAVWRSDGRLHMWHPQQTEPATEWEARIDMLMDLQEREFDEDRRIQLVHEVQEILAEEQPLIFLISPYVFTGIRNRWQNIDIPALGSAIWNLDTLWSLQEHD